LLLNAAVAAAAATAAAAAAVGCSLLLFPLGGNESSFRLRGIDEGRGINITTEIIQVGLVGVDLAAGGTGRQVSSEKSSSTKAAAAAASRIARRHDDEPGARGV
jgi:hypothetical protein